LITSLTAPIYYNTAGVGAARDNGFYHRPESCSGFETGKNSCFSSQTFKGKALVISIFTESLCNPDQFPELKGNNLAEVVCRFDYTGACVQSISNQDRCQT